MECNRLGMLIDLAHANAETVVAALKVTTKPVIISHTGLDSQLGQNPSMARMMMAKLISKEQAKSLRTPGGRIGVWTHLADSPLEYVQNVRALIDVIGIDHVCVGTDTKLTPANGGRGGPGRGPGGRRDGGPGGNGQGAPCPGPVANGLRGGPGGGPGRGRAGERTNDAWQGETVGFYDVVVSAMLKVGFTGDEIGKVGGGNACGVFDAATAGY